MTNITDAMEVTSSFSHQFTHSIVDGYEIHTFFSSIVTRRLGSQLNSTYKESFNISDWISGGKINLVSVYNDTNDLTSTIIPASDIDVNGVFIAAAFNLFLFTCFVLSYEVLRRYLPNIYASKFQREIERQRSLENKTGANQIVPLSWLGPVFGISWKKVLEEGGLDAYMYLRYIRMCFRITSVSAIWALLILWPIYSTGGGGATGWYHLSMANIKNNDWRFWVSTIFMYFFTMYCFYAMEHELEHFVTLRLEFLGKGVQTVHPQHHYSLMIERIPKALRSDKALLNYFQRLFPGKVHSARVVVNLPELNDLLERKIRTTRRLEKSIAFFEATKYRPTHVVGRSRFLCCEIECSLCDCDCRKHIVSNLDEINDDERVPKGSLVDSVDYYTRDLKLLNNQFLYEQKEKNKGAQTGNVSVLAENWFTYIAEATGDLENFLGLNKIAECNYDSFDDSETDFSTEFKIFHDDHAITPSPSRSYDRTTKRKNSILKDSRFVHSDYLSGDVVDKSENSRASMYKRNILIAVLLRLGFDFLFKGYKYVRRQISTNIDKKSRIGTMSSTGFVTFLDLTSVTSAVNSPLTHNPSTLLATVAPEPRDIFWSNAHISLKDKNRRENITNVAVAIGAILWSVPIAAIQALASVDRLAEIPGMEWLNDVLENKAKIFVNAYLPVVAMLTIMMVLPIIFEKIAVNFEKRKSLSDIHRSVVGRYFYYQLANVYIVVTAGSLWKSLATIITYPRSIFEIFGNSLPFVVGYFASLLITKILTGLPLVILRTGSLFRYIFLRIIFRYEKLSQRELDEVYRPEKLHYGWEYPNQLFVIVICFTYVSIAPIILVVGAVYFLVAMMVFKKQVLFVYTPQYESGGTLFPIACKMTVFGLILGQLTFIGYLLFRKCLSEAISTIPLLLLTPSLMHRLQRNYIDTSMALTLERAVDLDEAREQIYSSKDEKIEQTGKMKIQELFRDDYYRQPILTEKAGIPSPYRRGVIDTLTLESFRKLGISAADQRAPTSYVTSPSNTKYPSDFAIISDVNTPSTSTDDEIESSKF